MRMALKLRFVCVGGWVDDGCGLVRVWVRVCGCGCGCVGGVCVWLNACLDVWI